MRMWAQRYLWDYGEADCYTNTVSDAGPFRVISGDEGDGFVRRPLGFVAPEPPSKVRVWRRTVREWWVGCGRGESIICSTWGDAMEAAWGHLSMEHGEGA